LIISFSPKTAASHEYTRVRRYTSDDEAAGIAKIREY
jgi:hypothetical protein